MLTQQQKIRSTAYLSFSLFGLLFIFIFGGLLILVSFALDPLLSTLQRRYRFKSYQQLEWRTNDALQLQRLAYEEIGAGTWHNAAEIVPLTQQGEYLPPLDITDPEHPKLCVPSSDGAQEPEKGGVRVHGIEMQSINESTSRGGTSPVDVAMSSGTTMSPARSLIITIPTTPDQVTTVAAVASRETGSPRPNQPSLGSSPITQTEVVTDSPSPGGSELRRSPGM
jgi:hypothetical protein